VVAFGSSVAGAWLMLCVSDFSMILDSLTVFQIYWDLQDSF
jgi:hypothetical protein